MISVNAVCDYVPSCHIFFNRTNIGTTNIDISRLYLDTAKRNFQNNNISLKYVSHHTLILQILIFPSVCPFFAVCKQHCERDGASIRSCSTSSILSEVIIAKMFVVSYHKFYPKDIFEELKRMATLSTKYDLVLLDPPSVARSKTYGLFTTKRRYRDLIDLAAPSLRVGGRIIWQQFGIYNKVIMHRYSSIC